MRSIDTCVAHAMDHSVHACAPLSSACWLTFLLCLISVFRGVMIDGNKLDNFIKYYLINDHFLFRKCFNLFIVCKLTAVRASAGEEDVDNLINSIRT